MSKDEVLPEATQLVFFMLKAPEGQQIPKAMTELAVAQLVEPIELHPSYRGEDHMGCGATMDLARKGYGLVELAFRFAPEVEPTAIFATVQNELTKMVVEGTEPPDVRINGNRMIISLKQLGGLNVAAKL